MHTKLLFLIGAGGYGKIVYDAILLNNIAINNIRVRDSAESLRGSAFFHCHVDVPAVSEEVTDQLFHLAIGNSQARENLCTQLTMLNAIPFTLIHPMASVSQFSSIEKGVFVAAKSVVAANSSVGLCSIINHGAIVDHDCSVGRFSHIAPNVTLGGGVNIGSHVLIGAGVNILPGIKVGDHAVIGAGAVVTTDVAPGETRIGIPAKLKSRS